MDGIFSLISDLELFTIMNTLISSWLYMIGCLFQEWNKKNAWWIAASQAFIPLYIIQNKQ